MAESPKTAGWVDAPNTCPWGACVHDGQLDNPSLLPSLLPSPGPPVFVEGAFVGAGVTVGVMHAPFAHGSILGVGVGAEVGETLGDGVGVKVGVQADATITDKTKNTNTINIAAKLFVYLFNINHVAG